MGTSPTDPASKTFEWEYDALARLATIKNPQAEESEFGYDDASRLVRKTLASGAVTYHPHDAVGA
ncbi:MAG: hypothetical protein GF320_07905 [Armatimonadia bacterium]|nr:hypothetical protein [Armatimonadia bacterium]